MIRSDPCAVNHVWLRKMYGCALAVFMCVLAVSCGQAKAETRLGLHIISHHFSGDFNNLNHGAYIYHDGFTAGTYYNSERKQSYYVGYTFEGALVGPLSYGLTIGAVSGYARGSVLPLVVPSVSVPIANTGIGVRLSAIPPVGKGSAALVHLTAEYTF